MNIALVNPNTNAGTTATMVAIAREAAGEGVTIEGRTAGFGVPLITDTVALAVAAEAVLALAAGLAGFDRVIVAAFGDPGVTALRQRLAVPVIGIAEAAMADAAAGGRAFAVVTTTPDLVGAIAARAAQLGHARFCGTWLTPGDPLAAMADPARLADALGEAARTAIAEGGAEAIIIGGGPLALAARRLAGTLPVPLIEPVPAAVRRALAHDRKAATP